jgi:F-type H+-transporting ATPase subunit delta
MADSAVVRRYARALIDVAEKRGLLEQVGKELDGFQAIMKEQPRFARVLRAPVIAPARKRQLLRATMAGRVSDLTLRFLELLVEKEREEILPEIPDAYRRLAYEIRNIQPVEVTSAVELTAGERGALQDALARRTGKQIDLYERVDPALMGGAIIRIGDTIYDGSVRGQLRRLRKRLLASSGRVGEVS